jgi:alkylation response protein AidB-like acyl-CoA dehydrogenase
MAQAASAANSVTTECIQIHGGVGYTWENDSHVFLRRAKVDDLLLGAQTWQRERVADEYFATL